MELELQTKLEEINKNLEVIKKGRGIWRSFFNGMFGALGYMFGVGIVILLLGWYLNKTGYFPEIQRQILEFKNLMQQASKILSGSSAATGQGSDSQPQTYEVTLPNGEKVQVNK